MSKFWTKKKLGWLHDVALPKSSSIAEALSYAEKHYKRKLSPRPVYHGFRSVYGYGPGTRLKTETAESMNTTGLLLRENKRLKRELRAATNEAVSSKLVKSILHDVKQYKPETPTWLAKKPKAKAIHGIPTLFLSDIHHGEVVQRAAVNGANSFNMAISRKRLERIFSKAEYLLSNVLASAEYPGMVLALGGDLLSGNIHEELRETNEVPVAQALLDLADILTAGINLLRDRFGRLFVPCVAGNHGRFDRKPRMKNGPYEGFEYILYHLLASRFANDDAVTFEISDSFTVQYQVFGTRYLLEHGDAFRGGTGISGPLVPWTLGEHRMRKQLQAISAWTGQDVEYDVLIFGHWHTYFPSRTFIANGSVVGFNEFAKKMKFSFEPPTQALWLTHPEHGVTIQTPIYGERRGKAKSKAEWVRVFK